MGDTRMKNIHNTHYSINLTDSNVYLQARCSHGQKQAGLYPEYNNAKM